MNESARLTPGSGVRRRRIAAPVLGSLLALVLAGTGCTAIETHSGVSAPGAGTGASGELGPPPFITAPPITLAARNIKGTDRKQKQPERRTSARAGAGVPVRLIVPRLGVNAPVVGISPSNGILTPPGDATQLGWWSEGARPGAARGGALITGHTVSTGGGAFDDLETVSVGNRVRVRTTNGVVRYRVRSVTIYRKASLAHHAGEVFSQSVPGRLVLVTCEDWNGSAYLSNAVVLADPI